MHLDASRSRQRLDLLATGAIAGQVILLASAFLLPLVSEYRFVGDTISELALGRLGAVQTVAFLVSGVSTLGLAYAIRQMTEGAWGSRAGSLLVGIYGLGALIVAVFPTDRVDTPDDLESLSTTGLIHVAAALVSFLCITIGMFILTRTFLSDPRWRSLSRWMALFPAGALSLLIVQSQGPWVGLMQRLLVAVIAGWIIVVALRIRAIVATAEASAPT